jgi:hypothetical protein
MASKQPPLVTIRATEPERALIRQEAARRGLTQSDLIRGALESCGVPLSSARNNPNA